MASIHKRTIRWTTKAGELRTGERYQAQYVDRSGRRHRKLFALKRDAQAWLDEQTAGLVTGQWADPRAGKERLEAYGERWLRRQVHAESTGESYERALRNHIYPALGGLRLDSITPADVQSAVKQWSLTAAPTTVEHRYLVLAMVLRAAVRDRVLPVSPCIDITLPRIAPKSALVPITTPVVESLRDNIDPSLQALVIVGAGTGMRRGELMGLTLDRVSSEFGTIRVDRQLSRKSTSKGPIFVPPKTQASVRTIPVADVVLEAIAAHVETYGTHESGLLFTTSIGTPMSTSTLWTAWGRAVAAVGAGEVTPHDLRHYFASVQIAGGTSIKALQALLGHKSAVETWDTYGHLMGDEDDRSRSVIQNALANLGRSTGTAKGR